MCNCGHWQVWYLQARSRLEIQGGIDASVWSSKAVWRQNSVFLWGPESFFLNAFNWMDGTHPHYGMWLTLLKVYWFKHLSHLKTTSRLMFHQTSECHSLAKLTVKLTTTGKIKTTNGSLLISINYWDYLRMYFYFRRKRWHFSVYIWRKLIKILPLFKKCLLKRIHFLVTGFAFYRKVWVMRLSCNHLSSIFLGGIRSNDIHVSLTMILTQNKSL